MNDSLDSELVELARQVGLLLKREGWSLVTAESCTGGGIAWTITEIAGSSAWFDRSFVTYSNAAKVQMLGVKPETLEKYGAVSLDTVREMAAGALTHSLADWSIAVTGIAGPDGGTAAKPVGTVYIAWQRRGESAEIAELHLTGNRHEIRNKTIRTALTGWLNVNKPNEGRNER